MAKIVKLKDRNSNSILPITRSTVVEMNEGISVEEKFKNYYTKDEIYSFGYITYSYLDTKLNTFDKISKLTDYDGSYEIEVGDTHDEAFSKIIKIIDENEYVTAAALSELHNDMKSYVSANDLNAASYVTRNELSSAGYLTAHQSLAAYVSKAELNAAGYITSHQDLSSYVNTSYYNVDTKKIYLSHDNDIISEIDTTEFSVETLVEINYADLVDLRDNGELVPGTKYRIIDYECTTTQENTRSAGHQFDIIVTALNTNALSENAAATQHEGDTYFAKSKLNAWQLKYSLENDKVKYGWADTANGKGVIWYMKDEWHNECGYDFKNIMFTRKLTNGALDDSNGTDTFVYTFNGYLAGNQMDLSNGIDLAVAGGSGYITMCSENIIKSRYDYQNQASVVQGNGLMLLNDNVFLCSANNLGEINNLFVFGNVFEESCFENTLHGNANKNVFGKYCQGNIIGKECFANTFGYNCENNTFGEGCFYNTFGNSCYHNTFGNNCCSNTFGNNCYDNTFGNNCNYNTFGNECENNTFGNACENNTFGNGCSTNTFGDSCRYNTFGNNFGANTFGNEYNNNTFGNNCYDNTFGNNCENNTFGNDCHDIRFGNETSTINYVRYIQVENGVKYVDITTTATTSSTAYLQNITISQGVSGTETTRKTITHPTTNDNFQTIYRNDEDGTTEGGIVALKSDLENLNVNTKNVVAATNSFITSTTTPLPNGNVYINHISNDTVKSSLKIYGSYGVNVVADASANISVEHATKGLLHNTFGYYAVKTDDYGHTTVGNQLSYQYINQLTNFNYTVIKDTNINEFDSSILED